MRHSSAGSGNEDTSDDSDDFKDETIGVTKLCEILGLTRPPVHRLLKREAILSFMRGGSRRIKKTEVKRYLEQGDHPNSKKG